MKQKTEAGSGKQISLSGRIALAQRLQQALDELAERRGKTSYAQIAESSGKLITEGAITNLLSKKVGNPSALTLYGLARALEIDPHDLFDAALGISEPEGVRESKAWELFEAYQRIENPVDKQLASDMIDGVLKRTRALLPKTKADGPTSRVETIRSKTRSK